MSADRIFCYTKQRLAVVHFLREIGGIVSPRSPHAISEPGDIAGLEHINFIVIDHHQHPIPQRMWDEIIQRGAVVIHVDDQFDTRRRLAVRHHQGEQHIPISREQMRDLKS